MLRVLVTLLVYTLLFTLCFRLYGRGVGALAIVPVIALGWFYGTRGGVAAAVLSLPFNVLLVHLQGGEAIRSLVKESGGIAGTLALILIGAVVGRLSELRRQVRAELAERKNAEADARASNEFLENILDSSLDCIVVTDARGCVSRVNRAFLQMTGYREDEVIGRGMNYFLPETCGTYTSTTGKTVTLDEAFFRESADIISNLLERGRISSWEYYYRTRNGRVVPVDQNAVILCDRDKRPQGSVAIIRDITERKKAEETLRETSQTLLSLVQAAPLAIVVFDRSDIVSIWNPAAEAMFGWQAGDVVGRRLPFAGLPGAETIHERLRATIEHGTVITDMELPVCRRDGTMLTVSCFAAPLPDESSAPGSCLSIFSDITEQRRLQREILEVSGREQRRIGQDLHDGLGQVLTGVTFLGQALGKKLQDRGLPGAQDAVEITRLVNEAIAHTRSLARGLYPVTLETDGLGAALEELLENMENIFNISCVFSYNENFPAVARTTAIHLYRIVQEAVNNAVRHGRAGVITVSLAPGERQHVLSISDDGCGFDARTAGNTGMGINLMHYRARIIGGSLEISAQPGEGVTIRCTFPSAPEAQPEQDRGAYSA